MVAGYAHPARTPSGGIRVSRFDLRRLRSRDELVLVGREIVTEVRTDDVPSLAAAVAFKIVLALFPSLVAAVAIFSLLTDPAELSQLLARVAPGGVVEFLEPQLHRLIEGRSAGVALVVGVGVGGWAASGAAVTLNKALTRAHDMIDDRRLVKARIAALVVTVALLIALVGIFVLLVIGGRIEDQALRALPLTDTARRTIGAGLTIGRYVLSAVAGMLLFAFIYWVGPDYDHRPPYPWISPGAVLAVVTWMITSALFGLYSSTFGNFDASSVYGPLGSAILFMLWLQSSMFVLLLGAEINQVLQLRASNRISAAEVAGFGGEPAPPVPGAHSTGGTPASGDQPGSTI